jgi:hypothetical protein
MNCANHPDVERVAFCRTCGKPLCANCTREVKGVIYCENCIAERLQGVQPPQTLYQGVVDQGGGLRARPMPVPGPNPALAGILGAIPFGVGAVYNGQYAKGLAHLIIFVLLVTGASEGGDTLATICGFGIAFFVIYQIIDAVRSAKAIQSGQPAPDPFGLVEVFGGGTAQPGRPSELDAAGQAVRSGRVPTAAVVLIGLGILFFLQTAGVFQFGTHRLLALFLLGLGAWMLATRLGAVGPSYRGDRYGRSGRIRGLTGPAVLITLGGLFLLETFDNGPSFHRTWPLLLLVIGVTKLLERSGTLPPPPTPPLPPGIGPSGTTIASNPPGPQASASEVKNG